LIRMEVEEWDMVVEAGRKIEDAKVTKRTLDKKGRRSSGIVTSLGLSSAINEVLWRFW
jgi:hypothetical protein